MTRPYLVAWKLEGRRVLVVGGGTIGTAKIETLRGTGARIRVVDPTPSARCVDLADAGEIELVRRRFRPHDCWRATYVVAATERSRLNGIVRRCGRAAGAVVNVVDDPARCDVTTPAVVRRGPAVIAVTTGGATPAGARFLREELDAALPKDLGALLDCAASVRSELRADSGPGGGYRADYAHWRQLLFEPGMEALQCGNADALDELGRRFVAASRASVTGPTGANRSAGSGRSGRSALRPGRVTLVGAGPGGADLITVRGRERLRTADVVLYDQLADPALLDLAPVVAMRIPVGKTKGAGMAQAEINALIVDHAAAGRHVVRLKGGDPFVFGRGIEEIDHAVAHGVEVEVVPGLTSALSAPALAGLSVTDRRCASSVVVVSGHRANDPVAGEEHPIDGAATDTTGITGTTDWAAIARSPSTIVVLMAASTAAAVARQLEPVRADEPVAFIHQAGRPDQQIAASTVRDVVRDGCPFPSPTVMVIGAVAERARGPELRSDAVPR